MTMNVRRDPITLPATPEVSGEIARIIAVWNDCRSQYGKGGPFLFGRFSIADAMYAPVAVGRFRTYGVPLDDTSQAYVEAVCALPSVRKWVEGAKRETWQIEAYENVGK
jgi:glutathione S-transferase